MTGSHIWGFLCDRGYGSSSYTMCHPNDIKKELILLPRYLWPILHSGTFRLKSDRETSIPWPFFDDRVTSTRDVHDLRIVCWRWIVQSEVSVSVGTFQCLEDLIFDVHTPSFGLEEDNMTVESLGVIWRLPETWFGRREVPTNCIVSGVTHFLWSRPGSTWVSFVIVVSFFLFLSS